MYRAYQRRPELQAARRRPATEGQTSVDNGAALTLNVLPKGEAMLGDRGYDAD